MLAVESGDAAHPHPSSRTGWAMVARGFLCQNVAIGCAFGGFAVSLLPLQERYAAGRGEAAFGLALVVLVMSLMGPLVAWMIGRIGLRWTMLLGLLLSATGYVALAFAPSMLLALVAFAALVGPGVAMLGPMPASILAGSWIEHRRGLAVGLVNVPLLVAVVPLIGLAVISDHGLPAFYLLLAGLHLLILPAVIGIADRGRDAAAALHRPDSGNPQAIATRRLLAQPGFWAMAAGGGVLAAAGITGISHIVALAIEKGVAPTNAALLASLMGSASIVGSILIGAVCDRIGPARALALAALGPALSWTVLFSTTWLGAMIPAIVIAGACGAAVFPAVNVLAVERYGIESVGKVVGLYGLINLPLTFLLPPAAGALRDAAGSYDPVMLGMIILCVATALVFYAASLRGRRPIAA
jgi:MFS family permease